MWNYSLLCLSMAWSNIMSSPVTDPRCVHIAVSLRKYIILINTRHLFLLCLRIACPPPLIPEPHALLFPSLHDFRGSCLLLLWNHNSKNSPCRNVMVHTDIMVGHVLPNCPQPRFYQRLTNGGGTPIFHSSIWIEICSTNFLCRIPNARIIWGVVTHDSDPKISTDCTTATYNLPELLVSSPSHTNRCYNLPCFLFYLWRFLTVVCQSLTSKYSMCPRYLDLSTFYRILSQACNSIPEAIREALAARQRSYCSTPLLHISVPMCPSTNVSQGTNISHWSHRGWVTVPLFIIIIVSSTCWCINFSGRLGLLVAFPGHPSTRQFIYLSVHGKVIQYSFVAGEGGWR